MKTLNTMDLKLDRLNVSNWTSVFAFLGICAYITGVFLEILSLSIYGVEDYVLIKIQYIITGGIPLFLYLISILIAWTSILFFIAYSYRWRKKRGVIKIIEILKYSSISLMGAFIPTMLLFLFFREKLNVSLSLEVLKYFSSSYILGALMIFAYLFINSDYAKATEQYSSNNVRTLANGLIIIMLFLSFSVFMGLYLSKIFIRLPTQLGGMRPQKVNVWFSEEQRYSAILTSKKNAQNGFLDGIKMKKLHAGSEFYLFEKSGKIFLIPKRQVIAIKPEETLFTIFNSAPSK